MYMKQKLFFVITVISCLAGVSHADETHCSLINDDKERIACHLKNPEPKTTKIKGWFVMESRAMKSAIATQTAPWRVFCDEKEGTVSALLTCKDKQMTIVLSTACVMGATGSEVDVTYRLDEEDPITKKLSILRNTRALQLTDHQDSIAFAKSLLDKKQLNITINPTDQEPFSATFEIAKLKSKIKPLRKKCDW